MTDISEQDLEALRISTASVFLKPIDDWRDRVRDGNPEDAILVLAAFIGHMLAGLAVELGVALTISADGAGAVIAARMDEQLQALQARRRPGAMLQ